MHRRCLFTWVLVLLVVVLAPLRFAHAQASAPPLLLDASGAEGVDVAALRDAIARETRREVFVAGAAGAPASGERIVVSIRGARLHVRREPASLEREVALEASGGERVRQIALLAGNLTRSEADELLLQLRKPAPPVAELRPGSEARAAEGSVAYRRLESTLRYHIDAEVASCFAGGVAELVVGGVSLPTGFYVRNHLNEEPAGEVLLGLGGAALAFGVLDVVNAFVKRASLRNIHDRLLQRSNEPTEAVAEAEKAWEADAGKIRFGRKFLSATAVGVGAIGFGTGTAFALTTSRSAKDDGRASASAVLMGLGGALLVIGVHGWLTPTAEERYFEGYVRATGKVAVTPSVTPLPGGAAFALTGQF